jgi:hypothetical protein
VQKTALACLIAITISSCVTDGGDRPLPSDSVDIDLDLEAGATQTYQFEVEARAIAHDEGLRIVLDPTPEELEDEGVRVETSWTTNGMIHSEWPAGRLVAEANEAWMGTFMLELTNVTAARVERQVRVEVLASPLTVPGPTDDDFVLVINETGG